MWSTTSLIHAQFSHWGFKTKKNNLVPGSCTFNVPKCSMGLQNICGYIRLQILMVNPRDPSNHLPRMAMEPKYNAFRFSDWKPQTLIKLRLWRFDAEIGRPVQYSSPMDPFRVWETDSQGGFFVGALKNAPETRPFCAQGRRSQELQVVCVGCVCVFFWERCWLGCPVGS